MQGWIKLHREIYDTDIWHDVTTFRLFVFLIGKASHQDGLKYKSMEINRGQYIRSYRKLADDLSYKEGRGYKKYSLSTIKSCVNKLVKSERVNVKETELGTLFTIVNYAKYQDLEESNPETPNGLDDKVRTNAELTPNEVRTNAEQEQELKNLRIKELKESTTTADAKKDDAIVFYQNNFGVISPHVSEELLSWINDSGEELVLEALKRALERNKANWGYAKSILQSWHKKGFETVEQAKAEEVEFKNQQASKRPFYNQQPTREVVPDWFKERKNQGSVKNKSLPVSAQQDIAKRLAQYQSVSGGGT